MGPDLSSFQFITARHFMRERLASVVARRPTLQAYLDSVSAEGWKAVILLRLGPPFPVGRLGRPEEITAAVPTLPPMKRGSWSEQF